MATISIDGLDSAKLTAWLWEERKIFVTTIGQGDFHGIRISPNVYTTLGELDRFCDAVETAIRHGLPS
jgi:selenocysteine lyase/cysteine desulfurase